MPYCKPKVLRFGLSHTRHILMTVLGNHTQISPKTQHLHNKEVVEKENSGLEEAGWFFCSTNRGPGEAPAEAPSSTAPSAPLSKGNLPTFATDPQQPESLR